MLPSSFGIAPSGDPTGLDYLAEIAGKSGAAREAVTLKYIRERWIPDSMLSFASWPAVTITRVLGGIPHKLTVQVSPDFAKVGSDEATAVVVPMWPTTAQHAADELSVRTIGKNIARAVYEQAAVRGDLYLANPGEPFYNLKNGTPRNIDDSGAWAASDKKRIAWLDKKVPLSQRATTLVAGYSKDVVQQRSALSSGKIVTGNQLAIYGAGGGKVDGWAIQSFPGPHEWSYGPDYSHGIRFARNRATLQVGDLPRKNVRLDEIAKDPVLSQLLVDTGPFNNRMSLPTGTAASFALGGDVAEGFDPVLGTYVPSSDRIVDDDSMPGEHEDREAVPARRTMSALGVGARTFGIVLGIGLVKMALRPRSSL